MEGYDTHARYLGEQRTDRKSEAESSQNTDRDRDREITVTNSLLRLKTLFASAVFPSGSISSGSPRVSHKHTQFKGWNMPSTRDSEAHVNQMGGPILGLHGSFTWFMQSPCTYKTGTLWTGQGLEDFFKNSRVHQTWKGSSPDSSALAVFVNSSLAPPSSLARASRHIDINFDINTLILPFHQHSSTDSFVIHVLFYLLLENFFFLSDNADTGLVRKMFIGGLNWETTDRTYYICLGRPDLMIYDTS